MVESRDVAAILLAAGRSERFGADDKLLAPLGGKPLAQHAAERIAALRTGRRIAVCARASGPLADILAQAGFEIVVNSRPDLGLSTSLRCGIDAAANGPAEAALLCLADMPFVGTSHLAAMLERFDAARAPVLASAGGSTAMPPALFARAMFPALSQLDGDKGARDLLGGAELMPAPPEDLADIDRPEDLPMA